MGRFYDLAVWRRFRRRELAKRPLCEDCLQIGVTRSSTELDHVIAIKDSGAPLDPKNTRALCKPCHSSKTASRDGGFGRAKGEQRIKGCDADGVPFDPAHPWRKAKEAQR